MSISLADVTLTGADLVDPNGNKYLTNGTITVTLDKRFDQIVTFDGKSTVMLPVGSLTPGNTITISFWAAPKAVDQDMVLVFGVNERVIGGPPLPLPGHPPPIFTDPNAPEGSLLSDEIVGVYLPFHSTGQVGFHCGNETHLDGLAKNFNEDGAKDIVAGEWAHWAFTKDAKTGEGLIYRNGKVWARSTEFSAAIGQATSFCLGGKSVDAPSFAGRLAQFRIMDRVLSQAEIAVLIATNAEPFLLTPVSVDQTARSLATATGSKFDLAGKLPGIVTPKPHLLGLDFQEAGFVDLTKGFSVEGAQITIAFWLYPQEANRSNTVFQAVRDGKGAATDKANRCIEIHLPWREPHSNQLKFVCGSDGKTPDIFNVTLLDDDLAVGQWTHWVFTKDSRAASANMSIFRNGKPWSTAPPKTGTVKPIMPAGRVVLGSDPALDCPFAGSIADFSIFHTALTKDQIVQLLLAQLLPNPVDSNTAS